MNNELTTVEGLQVSPDFAKLIVIGSKPTVPQLIEAAKAYYLMPGNAAGGSLHIVLDDCNIEDNDIKWCIDYANFNGDNEGVLLAKMLLKASLDQRRKLVNSYGAYSN